MSPFAASPAPATPPTTSATMTPFRLGTALLSRPEKEG